MRKILSLAIAATFAMSGISTADILVTDDFTYADGDLVPNGGWVSHSGTPGTLDVVSGAVSVTQDSGSEDAHVVFTPVTKQTLVAEFDIVVTADGPMSGSDFEYFAHFMNDGTFDFLGRVDVQTPNGSGDYTLGIGDGSSSDSELTVDFNFGDVVPVVLSYEFATGIASLTAGGATASADADPIASLDSFSLRQSNSSSDETITVDNLVVSVIPEPSSIALLGLAGLAGVVRRRK